MTSRPLLAVGRPLQKSGPGSAQPQSTPTCTSKPLEPVSTLQTPRPIGPSNSNPIPSEFVVFCPIIPDSRAIQKVHGAVLDWLPETAEQAGAATLDLLGHYGSDRLMFGTDFPKYPSIVGDGGYQTTWRT